MPKGEIMDKFFAMVDDLPFIVKILLCIPFVAIFWTVYRLLKSIAAKNILGIVLAAVLIIVGVPFLWLVDLIFIIIKGSIWWLD